MYEMCNNCQKKGGNKQNNPFIFGIDVLLECMYSHFMKINVEKTQQGVILVLKNIGKQIQ